MTDPLNIYLEDFIKQLSTRTANCIRAEFYDFHSTRKETVRELVAKRRNDLLKIPNFGKHSLAEVEKALSKLGLCLADEMNPPKMLRSHYDKALMREARVALDRCAHLLYENYADYIEERIKPVIDALKARAG